MFLVANGLTIVGACVLGISLYPIRKLVDQLPSGNIRRRWKILSALIIFFIAGYVGYTIANWNNHKDVFDLIVPAVFFFGAIFVLLVCQTSLRTALDIRRISVLERESITDPLIGIYNRRHFDRRLTEEIAVSKRYDLPLSMLMLDIDHFKSINDKYGHQVGDLVLKNLGRVILKVVRETDIVARYGGEEIAVVLPLTPVDSAANLAERLRKAIEQFIIVPADENKGSKALTMTVSIGVAGLDERVTENRVLIENTDKALYKAKQMGRNRVVVSGGLDPPL